MHRMRKGKTLILLWILLLVFSGCGRKQTALPQDSLSDFESVSQTWEETETSGEAETLEGADAPDGQETGEGEMAGQESGGQKVPDHGTSGASGKETGASQNSLPEQTAGETGAGTQTKPDPTEEKPEEPKNITCTIYIDCRKILENMEQLKAGHEAFVPEDGWLLEETAVTVKEGTTVLEVLTAVCREKGLSLEQNSGYIKGIQQLHEKDCGKWSGWMYQVNGTFPNTGCGSYRLHGGEMIGWLYTCDMGNDLK